MYMPRDNLISVNHIAANTFLCSQANTCWPGVTTETDKKKMLFALLKHAQTHIFSVEQWGGPGSPSHDHDQP